MFDEPTTIAACSLGLRLMSISLVLMLAAESYCESLTLLRGNLS